MLLLLFTLRRERRYVVLPLTILLLFPCKGLFHCNRYLMLIILRDVIFYIFPLWRSIICTSLICSLTVWVKIDYIGTSFYNIIVCCIHKALLLIETLVYLDLESFIFIVLFCLNIVLFEVIESLTFLELSCLWLMLGSFNCIQFWLIYLMILIEKF